MDVNNLRKYAIVIALILVFASQIVMMGWVEGR